MRSWAPEYFATTNAQRADLAGAAGQDRRAVCCRRRYGSPPGSGRKSSARPSVEQFIVENRGGGASGSIGVESVAKSPADGYTLLYTPNASLAVVPTLRKVNYDPLKDFEPIGRTGDGVYGFAIHPSLGIKTFNEMVEYAEKNPGKLVYGSSGVGMANHLRIEAVKIHSNVDILHVPYRGGADT